MQASFSRSRMFVLVASIILVTLFSINVSAEERFTIENPLDWDTTLIDASTSEPSGNDSAYAGDYILISIEIYNSDTTAGHDEWWFIMEIQGQSSPELTGFLEGSQDVVLVNFSFGPLPEGVLLLTFGIESSGQNKSLALEVEPNPINLTAAGSPEIAITGEPVHKGDMLTASILVHNQGNSPQIVSLQIIQGNLSPIQGAGVEINPGSSREVSTSFLPSSVGSLILDWSVVSNGGGVARELNGSTTIEVLDSQSLDLVIDSINWDLENGLNSEVSLYLSQGRSRTVEIEISIVDQAIESTLQTFQFMMDPGKRDLILPLGNPSADSLIIRVTPISWLATNNIEIQTTLVPPFLDLEVIAGVPNPSAPIVGGSVLLPFSLTNNGNTPTLMGEVRVVRNSDRMILDSVNIEPVNSGGVVNDEFSINNWPNSKVVEVEIIWITSGQTKSKLLEIETFSDPNEDAELPFDLMASIYGTISGLVIVIFVLVLYRTVSENVEDTGKSRSNQLRVSRGEKKKIRTAEKREVNCPECDQRLNIPYSHTGAVKCPACTSRFTVEAIPTNDEDKSENVSPSEPESIENNSVLSNDLIARSPTDMLTCPSCDQKLKVPLERRPVKARCPACRSEFLAEMGD